MLTIEIRHAEMLPLYHYVSTCPCMHPNSEGSPRKTNTRCNVLWDCPAVEQLAPEFHAYIGMSACRNSGSARRHVGKSWQHCAALINEADIVHEAQADQRGST